MRSANPYLIPVLIALSLGAVLVGCLAGSSTIGVGQALGALTGQEADPAVGVIVREIRLPRVLAAFSVGAVLALSGGALQGLLRNPLADPGVLGVSSMAALGAVIAIFFNLFTVTPYAVPLMAMAMALATTALLYALGAGRVSVVSLLLIGIGLTSFAGALTALAMNLSPNPFNLTDMVNWLLGSVANRSLEDLFLTGPFMFAGAAALVLAGPGLRALSLGEEAAFAIGADLALTRLLVIAGSAVAVGASVALAGPIGFVGLVTPHLIRPLVGSDPARLLVPSAVLGGLMLVLADLAVRLVFPFDQELRISVVAALFGAPAFVVIAGRLKGAVT